MEWKRGDPEEKNKIGSRETFHLFTAVALRALVRWMGHWFPRATERNLG